MGYLRRGVRTGDGPYKDSYRRRVERKSIGRRRAKGIKCPKRK